MMLLITRNTFIPKNSVPGPLRWTGVGEVVDVVENVAQELLRQSQARQLNNDEVIPLQNAYAKQQEELAKRKAEDDKKRQTDDARKSKMQETWATFWDGWMAQFESAQPKIAKA